VRQTPLYGHRFEAGRVGSLRQTDARIAAAGTSTDGRTEAAKVMLVPLHSDYDSLGGSGYARPTWFALALL
jgi:hypothetical protein